MWIDVHTHLDKLNVEPEEALEFCSKNGVERVITIGTEPEDHDIVLSLAKKFYPKVSCTIGVHPHEAKKYNDEVEESIAVKLGEKEVVAVGEIGLDYYYEHSDREKQKEAFRRQMDLAEKHHLPVEVHTRDAEEDTAEILQEYKGRVRGLLHCFTSSQWLADQALDVGWNISISGVVTFKNAQSLRDTVKTLPLDRIHVETDAPFLAPVPQRGQKNRPDFVIHTAAFVSELKGVTEEQLAEQTKKNALAMFPKLNW